MKLIFRAFSKRNITQAEEVLRLVVTGLAFFFFLNTNNSLQEKQFLQIEGLDDLLLGPYPTQQDHRH